ncbi:Phage repressor protein C, contains Cro/C1-type HTH and peptisase s24 domains [Pseudomonas costantinii]|uniref:Phage repressor protein C, contains Cro/C1-type HTH and peptisase s24 domains n=2 Tax=Pseudomonas costantinii TaxID=168469 RepID=A0A1H5JMU8_9PSED|nr:Phage repressor protein C, contains Cro/C1-type HTH and peptisase s24 domains [Pseudomonas costantinii]
MSTFSIELNAGILARMDIYAIRKQQLISLIGNQRKGACAERWGMAPAHLSQILSDKTAKNLGDDVARRIEAIEKLPRGWFDSISTDESNALVGDYTEGASTGEALTQTASDQVRQMLSKVRGLSSAARDRIIAAADETSNVITVDFSRPGQVGDEVWIAHYDVRGAMGDGQVPHDYPETFQDVRVSPSHLRELGVQFKDHFHLKMISGQGESMAPTIKSRDPLLIDVTIREFTGDGIYALTWQNHFYIKRLQVLDEDNFEMLSDNPLHGPRTIRKDDTYIQGRILFVWNGQPV